MPLYEKPRDMPQKTWDMMNEIVRDDTSEKSQNFINSFTNQEQLNEHLTAVRQQSSDINAYIDLALGGLNTFFMFKKHPALKIFQDKGNINRNTSVFKSVGDIQEAYKRHKLKPFIKGYESILTDNYNKLPRKSQPIGIKEAVNALAPMPAGNANIVNQSPLTIGIPQ